MSMSVSLGRTSAGTGTAIAAYPERSAPAPGSKACEHLGRQMAGYFSISDRGTYGHWDFSDERGRFATLRGGDAEWQLTMERRPQAHVFRTITFSTPFEAVEYVTRHVMPDA